MNIQELARQYANWFETATRSDGTDFIRLKTEDENIKQLIRDAHGDFMPCDIKYQFIHDALEAISETDDIDNICLESDCYTRDLLKWLSSNLQRILYCDEVIENYGYSTVGMNFIDIISKANLLEKNEVLYCVRASLNALYEGM